MRHCRMAPRTPVAVTPKPGPALDDWNLLRAFLAIYETGTLTEAAKRLATTQPSMGRHLRELEAQLGETLFTRLPGRLKPTARADALFEAAVPMRHAARDAETLFTEQRERIVGVVRLAVSEVYGYQVIPRLLAPLLAEQPELEIELAVSNQADNLLRRDADIAVRFFRPQQQELIVRKLGETELGLFVHEDYLARWGEPKGFEFPPAAVLAGFDRESVALGEYFPAGQPPAAIRFRFRSDSALARAAMVSSGAAIGMFLTDVAADTPGLKRVLAGRVGMKQEVWLCAHDELRRSRRMRFVWERLGDALEARLAAFGGAAG